MHLFDMKTRRAVITGGGQGIGRAIAERILASGGKVSLWDQDAKLLASTARELAAAGTVHTAAVDVTDEAGVAAALRSTVDALSGVDILVACAGIAGPNVKTWEYPLDEWRRVVDVDLTGVFLCCRAVVPLMIAQRYGRIVAISSVAGKEGNPNASAYSAAKAGVIALTKSLGKELATENIAVNCITPAVTRTGMLAQSTQAHLDYMVSKIPRGRILEVGEVASLVTWLVSEENSFSTGAVFDISGGRSTY